MADKLVLHEVTKLYGDGDSTLTVLNRLSFRIGEGELAAVLGPSGSGKSTFLSIAGALLTPTSGEVLLDGQSVSGLSGPELARLRLDKIGFMFQSAHLIPYLKVEEQLLYIAKLAGMKPSEGKQRARALLDELGLMPRSGYYPQDLSGGEKQRVAIARAMMNQPALLLADEPTSSLDFKRGREVVELLAAEVKRTGRAAVMVTHDERLLDLCDRVLHLEDGVLQETARG
jgi:putative ABC transport system ATP-binding protein